MPTLPGGYLKRTADYTVQPGEMEDAPRLHPHNDPSLMNCSRCGCTAGAHEVAEGDNARAQGNDAFAMGDFKKAVAAYSSGIAAAPGDARGYSNRAAVLVVMGNPSGALADAKRAVQIEPDWSKARARAGEALTVGDGVQWLNAIDP